MNIHRIVSRTAFFFAALLSSAIAQQFHPSNIFSDNMVLQRDMQIPVWGTAAPGTIVKVTLGGNEMKAVTTASGEWKTKFDAMPAGGPYELSIEGNTKITYKNVMIGEVWVCSGQSNMNMPVGGWGMVYDYRKEIANAQYPDIRLFTVNQSMAGHPSKIVQGSGWRICSPAEIENFSAAAYFFARELYNKYKIPIGLIHSSWGATNVEAWMDSASLSLTNPEMLNHLSEISDDNDKAIEKNFKKQLADWRAVIEEAEQKNFNRADILFDDSDWQEMELPSYWDKYGMDKFDGSVWFRKNIFVPDNWITGKDSIYLSVTDDYDVVYINGKKIGANDKKNDPTTYAIPAGIIKTGMNLICVRVLDMSAKGGIWNKNAPFCLRNVSGLELPLAGKWKYAIGIDLKDFPVQPKDPMLKKRPTVLFNAMIAPLIPYAIRGALWYQGESNAANPNSAFAYRSQFKNMISGWRRQWGQGDFPFYFVQIAGYGERSPEPRDNVWAVLRESQAEALALTNVGMVTAIDIGDADDIHPKNKYEVGRRLALLAEKDIFKENQNSRGPKYLSMSTKKNQIRILFDLDHSSLTVRGDELLGFTIAGVDRKFYRAKAVIDDGTVIVSADEVAEPVAVRYAWDGYPECTLFNSDGLPAFPFRTDEWDVTGGIK